MPKLNAVLMVLLSAAVLGGMGWWVLGRGDDGALERVRAAKLLRKLADADPDLRREAEAELRALGAKGKEILRETAKAADVRLAERASALLKELEPAPEPAPVPDVKHFIRCVDRFHVEFRNDTGAPLLIAVEKQGDAPRFGWFEIEDAAGKVAKVAAPSYAPPVVEGPAHLITLAPGAREVLYNGWEAVQAALAGAAHPCKLRFVYDASEGSPYRDVAKVSERSAPLRPGRHVSPAVDIP
jgi:hypothetical protein